MKTYILKDNCEIITPDLAVNKRGFCQEDIEKLMQDDKYKSCSIICIEDEIDKYHLSDGKSNCWGLDEEVFHYQLWYEAYIDNSLNGFSLPIKVGSNSEYRSRLEQKFCEYVKYLDRPAFAYEKNLLDCIEIECKLILDALDNLINGMNRTRKMC